MPPGHPHSPPLPLSLLFIQVHFLSSSVLTTENKAFFSLRLDGCSRPQAAPQTVRLYSLFNAWLSKGTFEIHSNVEYCGP